MNMSYALFVFVSLHNVFVLVLQRRLAPLQRVTQPTLTWTLYARELLLTRIGIVSSLSVLVRFGRVTTVSNRTKNLQEPVMFIFAARRAVLRCGPADYGLFQCRRPRPDVW